MLLRRVEEMLIVWGVVHERHPGGGMAARDQFRYNPDRDVVV